MHAVVLWNAKEDVTNSLSMQSIASYSDGSMYWSRNGALDAYWCVALQPCSCTEAFLLLLSACVQLHIAKATRECCFLCPQQFCGPISIPFWKIHMQAGGELGWRTCDTLSTSPHINIKWGRAWPLHAPVVDTCRLAPGFTVAIVSI